MDWGATNKPLGRWVSVFLNSDWMPTFERWSMALARRWPSIPWVSKHIVVRETPDGTSIRRVFGSQSDPIAPSELAQSTLPITLVLQEHQVLHQYLRLTRLVLAL